MDFLSITSDDGNTVLAWLEKDAKSAAKTQQQPKLVANVKNGVKVCHLLSSKIIRLEFKILNKFRKVLSYRKL